MREVAFLNIRPLDKSELLITISDSSTKTYGVCTQTNRLNETGFFFMFSLLFCFVHTLDTPWLNTYLL